MEQLIYTSAPRLLDAGKSGFGTIARGRDIPRALVNYLERISTFDRAAGVDSLRYYTVFSAAGLRFHIFSRVQDCGADYTGRTNHVAHHFIAEEGSAEYAALSAGTPAGTMLALQAQWCKRWDEPPRWLDPVPLPTSLPKGEKFAWTRITDNQANAGWLCAEEYHQGATLVFDCEISAEQALGLLHDAYLRRPDHGWGTGFCTAKVTNISSSATPYICLDARQAEAGISPGAGSRRLSVRAPMAPPPPSVFRAPEKESIAEQEPAAPASGEIVVEEIEGEDPSPVVSSDPPTNPPVRSPFGAPAQSEPRPFVPGRPTKKRTANTSNKAIGVFVLLLIGVVALFWKISSDKEQTRQILQMAGEYAAQVESAVDLYKEAECPLAKKEFEKVSPEALKKAVGQQDAAQCEKHRLELEACWTRFIDALVREGNQKVQELKKYNLSQFGEEMKEAARAVSAANKDIRLCKDKLAEYCKKLRQAKEAVALLDELGKFIPFEKADKKELETVYRDEIQRDVNENRLKSAGEKITASQVAWEDKKKEIIGRAEPCKGCPDVLRLMEEISNSPFVNSVAYNKLESALKVQPPAVNAPSPVKEPAPREVKPALAEASVQAEPQTPFRKEEVVTKSFSSFRASIVEIWVTLNKDGVETPEQKTVVGSDMHKALAPLKALIKQDGDAVLVASFTSAIHDTLLEGFEDRGISSVTIYRGQKELKEDFFTNRKFYWQMPYSELERNIEKCLEVTIIGKNADGSALDVHIAWESPAIIEERVVKKEWKEKKRLADLARKKAKAKEQQEDGQQGDVETGKKKSDTRKDKKK